ncbi:MAG TPA: ATP-binding cassette domain-containing protein [Firmicutes bacterium]|nr:ATP-binding cassette domain-containing protein [Bacillota bacterium]
MDMPLLETKGLKKYFKTGRGMLHAVDDVNFKIFKGQTLGVVGESGCGKSTLGRVMIRLLDATEGEVLFEGKNIMDYDKHQMAEMRKELQIIFQDPYASLNPRMSVSEIIAEPLKVCKIATSKSDLEARVFDLMKQVGLAERLVNAFPHELDGGRRQRIGVARALAVEPKFIVCDEPVSALDVSIQAQILNLLMDLQDQLGLTYMFITHDLSVVKHISTEIAVMYLGQCVEKAPSDELFEKPLHPYTQALLSAIPIPSLKHRNMQNVLSGEVTSPIEPKPGCRFAARCPYAKPECTGKNLELKEVSPNHFVSCIKFQ